MCELKWCKSGEEGWIRVTENIGDGAFSVFICDHCADALGINGGDDLPEPEVVQRCLK